MFAISRDIDDAHTTAVVWPLQILHTVEDKVIVMNIDAIARFHPHVAFHAVLRTEGNANHRHTHAKMAQHHAPVAA